MFIITQFMTASATRAETRDEREYNNWLRRRPDIERVEVAGNAVLSSRTIMGQLQAKPSGSLLAKLGLKKHRRLLGGAVDRDLLAILRLYRSRGFWQATANASAVRDTLTDRAIVRYTIDEGPRWYWGDVTLQGASSGLAGRLDSKLRALRRGRPADTVLLLTTQTVLRATAADHAHPYSTVRSKHRLRGDTVDVTYVFSSGPKAYFGELTVEGNRRTREHVVAREVGFRTGDPYSRRRLLEGQQDVYATGMFSFARLAPRRSDSLQRTHPDFVLRVVERKPHFAGFQFGAGQDEERDLTVDVGGELGSRNWRGSGRRWKLSAEWGFVLVTDYRIEQNRFEVSYTEPWVLGRRWPTTLTFAYEPPVRQGIKPYRLETIAGDLNIQRRLARRSRVWLSLVYEKKNFFDIDPIVDAGLIEDADRQVNRKIAVAYEKDTRPNIFNPRTGSLTLVAGEYVGGFLGGDANYSKVEATWSRYRWVAPSVLATRLQIGWAHEHSGDPSVPTDERFRLGGANSIRGYSELGVGPQDESGRPLGGNTIALANIELRTPLFWKFWHTMFVDAGNNWSDANEIRLDNVLISFGAGLQFMTPIGPLRLDYARRVSHPGHPASDRAHLSILFAF